MMRRILSGLLVALLVMVGVVVTTTGPAAAANNASISGTVTADATGSPIAGVQICAYQSNDIMCNGATTAANGTFTVGNLAAGSYWVSFQKAGFADECSDNKVPTGVLGAGCDVIVLTAGQAVTGVNAGLAAVVAPPTTGTISGTVTDEVTGMPISGVWVAFVGVTCAAPMYCPGTLTAADGTYSKSGLPPGSRLIVFEDGVGTYDTECFDGQVVSVATCQMVPLAAGEMVDHIDASMIRPGPAGPVMSGTAHSQGGTPVAGVNVAAYDSSTGTDSTAITGTTTGPDGAYQLRLPARPGYVVVFSSSSAVSQFVQCFEGVPAIWVPTGVFGSSKPRCLSDPTVVPPAASIPNIDVTVVMPISVGVGADIDVDFPGDAGRTYPIDPVTGDRVFTMHRSSVADLTVSSRPTCAVGVAPSQVTLRVAGQEFPMVEAPAGSGSWTVTVAKQFVQTGLVELRLTCPGGVKTLYAGRIVLFDPSGHITDADTGEPVVDAEVTLHRVPGWTAATSPADTGATVCQSNASKPEGEAWSQPAPMGIGVVENPLNGLMAPEVNPFLTDEAGYYGWDVAAGCWYVTVSAAGYAPLTSPVVGVPSEVTDLDLELDPVTTVCIGQGAGPFNDVAANHPFCADIEWLVVGKIAAGYDNGTYRPTVAVTRQAMASFLYKYERKPSVSLTQPFFADVEESHPFYAAIQWMAESGLSTGSVNPMGGKPLFKPADAVSRQAMAAFLWRNAGQPAVGLTTPFFSDMSGGPLFSSVQWMAETGLSQGTANLPGKPLYKPTNPVSRQALAAFLHRYDGLS